MTGMPRGRIYQSTLFQSTGCVWNPGSLDPSYSTRMANANGGATCFSSIHSAAIYNTSLISSVSLDSLCHSVIYSDIFTGAVLQEMTGKEYWEFPCLVNIKLISSFSAYTLL